MAIKLEHKLTSPEEGKQKIEHVKRELVALSVIQENIVSGNELPQIMQKIQQARIVDFSSIGISGLPIVEELVKNKHIDFDFFKRTNFLSLSPSGERWLKGAMPGAFHTDSDRDHFLNSVKRITDEYQKNKELIQLEAARKQGE